MKNKERESWEYFQEMLETLLQNQEVAEDEQASFYLQKSLSIREECEELMRKGAKRAKLRKMALRGLYYLYLSKRCTEGLKEEQ